MRSYYSRLAAVLTCLIASVFVVAPAAPGQARPIEENFQISVAGAFGAAYYRPGTADKYRVSINQSNQIEQQAIEIHLQKGDSPEMALTFSSRDSSKKYLEVGYYNHAQRYPFTDPGRPGISLSSWSDDLFLGFCSEEYGNFEVRDLQLDSNGISITKLWITYQRWCDQEPVFGEVRLGYPDSTIDASMRNIRWPGVNTYPGRQSYDAPVLVRNSSSTTVNVNSVSITGAHAGDFPLRGNDCSGQLTATGCLLSIGFTPKAPGPRHAKAKISTTAGDIYVALDGWGALGTADWAIDVNYEDSTRTDEHLVMNSASIGSPYEIRTQGFQGDGTTWNARFQPPTGTTFAPGHYEYKADGAGLRVSLARGNNACEVDRASIDIADIAYSGPDQRLERFDLTMNVHCRSASAYTVSGRLRYHTRNDVTAPGAVQNLEASRWRENVTVTWTNPASSDLAGVLVRWYAGPYAPSATDGGEAVYLGTGQSVTFEAVSGAPAAISVWAYDTAGNLSLVNTLLVGDGDSYKWLVRRRPLDGSTGGVLPRRR